MSSHRFFQTVLDEVEDGLRALFRYADEAERMVRLTAARYGARGVLKRRGTAYKLHLAINPDRERILGHSDDSEITQWASSSNCTAAKH